MDQEVLVSENFSSGRMLLERLTVEGFDVIAGAWVRESRESEEGPWFFYVASKEVDDRGIIEAYRQLSIIMAMLPDLWIDPFGVKLVGADDLVTQALLKVRGQLTGTRPRRIYQGSLGDRPIMDAYVYPAVATVATGS